MQSISTKKKVFQGLIYIFALIGLVFTSVFIGMQFGVFNVRGNNTDRNNFFITATSTQSLPQTATESDCIENTSTCEWNKTRQWAVVSAGLEKDSAVIQKVSQETGVPTRVLVSVIIPEQLRFFTAEREVFKKYFEPLKILGSMSQFSLGVSGIKPDTAKKIEDYANATSSPFYPGDTSAKLLAYTTAPSDNLRYDRLTDSKNHYYSYLYTAIYIKEIENQWKSSGVDISQNQEILATLFNLGFLKSNPHQNPGVGGAPITIGGNTYSYGELSNAFYKSKELSIY